MSLAQFLQNLGNTRDVTTINNYKNTINNTEDQYNNKDVTTDIYDVQNGNRILGRDFDINAHANMGSESFGLMNLKNTKHVTTINNYKNVINNSFIHCGRLLVITPDMFAPPNPLHFIGRNHRKMLGIYWAIIGKLRFFMVRFAFC